MYFFIPFWTFIVKQPLYFPDITNKIIFNLTGSLFLGSKTGVTLWHELGLRTTSSEIIICQPGANKWGLYAIFCLFFNLVLKRVYNDVILRWRYFTTKPKMLCQNAFLFKFVSSLGNRETTGKISLTIEATNSVLVLVVKWRHHANGVLFSSP